MTSNVIHYKEIVERIFELSLDEKEDLKNLIERNNAEERRNEIADNYKLTKIEEKEGKLIFSDDIDQLKKIL